MQQGRVDVKSRFLILLLETNKCDAWAIFSRYKFIQHFEIFVHPGDLPIFTNIIGSSWSTVKCHLFYSAAGPRRSFTVLTVAFASVASTLSEPLVITFTSSEAKWTSWRLTWEGWLRGKRSFRRPRNHQGHRRLCRLLQVPAEKRTDNF